MIRWFREHELNLVLVVLLFLFAVAFFWSRMVFAIKPGYRGVLWSRFTGTKVDRVYPEGINVILPWNELTLYDVRYQVVDRSFTLLSKDGLPVIVDLTARFRPSDKVVGKLQELVGPNYPEVVVVPEVATSLRTIVARYAVNDLYQFSFSQIQKDVQEHAAIRCAERYVILDQVLFRGITLPPSVSAAIQRKVEQQQAAEEMQYRLAREHDEAERKMIEAEGIQEFQRVVGSTLTAQLLQFKAIEANLELAKSNNAKVIVQGAPGSVPIILNTESPAALPRPAANGVQK